MAKEILYLSGKDAAAVGLRPQHMTGCAQMGTLQATCGVPGGTSVCSRMTAVTSHGLVCLVWDKSTFCFGELPELFSCIISSHGWLLPQPWTQKASSTDELNDHGRKYGQGCRMFRQRILKTRENSQKSRELPPGAGGMHRNAITTHLGHLL